ncbi:uncharacterized protein LOC103718583 isoform X3 [Phoenix dactylifera]|uniref:Uncharacterized protein LOC103718583 isoform X3 n=1 Tax=Phoenix dactylifera TaxID=42345 RepID=A0A8B7CSW9_PHODC|nr:uncharacterized protein LOC103718583 isoform X3 [Phoenix dactylifera]
MVVCKCRKATRLYCFVHKVPVCGECICFPEHQICVIWPPTSIKDTGSRLYSKLKEAIIQSGLEKNIFGSHLVSLPAAESRVPPPAFASDPLMHVSGVEDRDKRSADSFTKEGKHSDEVYSSADGKGSTKLSEPEIIEIDGPSSLGNQYKPDQEPNFMKSASPKGPGATTRKGTYHVERQNSEISYYADDEDGTHKKYTRRGPFRHKFLRMLLPFWSNALPTLPVTAPPRKDLTNTNDVLEGRVRQRSSRMDPRKILLVMAIMACLATMGILYYRLAQRSLGEEVPEDEPQ